MALSLNLPQNHDKGREDVVQGLIKGRFSTQAAAEALASISLTDSCHEVGVGNTWEAIFVAARLVPEVQEKLADLLVCMSKLPPPKDEGGQPLILYGERIWEGMPMLGWTARDEWDVLLGDSSSEGRPENQHGSASFVNISRFLARMEKTSIPALSFRSFALWTMRSALEYPGIQRPETDPLMPFVPAAAAWVDVVGAQMYHWTDEYPQGPIEGAPGSGGPLWEGKHGFCAERWRLWSPFW